MLPVVVFDFPADLAASAAEVSVARCAEVLGDGRCRPLTGGAASGPIGYYAVVRSVEGEQLAIDFRVASPNGVLLAQRLLAFVKEDSIESRWASAGLVVAGLVAAADVAQQTVPVAPRKTPPAPPPRVDPVPAHSAPRPTSHAWGLDMGFAGARGLSGGADNWGPLLRPWLGVSGASGVVLLTTLRYEQGPQRPVLRWLSMSGGVGSRLGRPSALLNAELLGEVVLERLLVSGRDTVSGRTETGGQTRFGGKLGLNLALRVSTSFRLLFGADIATMAPPVRVEVGGVLVAREPAVRAGVNVGVRLGG